MMSFVSSESTISPTALFGGSLVVVNLKVLLLRIAPALSWNESGEGLTIMRCRKPKKRREGERNPAFAPCVFNSAADSKVADLGKAADPHPAHPSRACRAGGGRGVRRRLCVLLLGSSIAKLICSGVVPAMRYLRGVCRVESYSVPCGCFGRRVWCWRLYKPISHN